MSNSQVAFAMAHKQMPEQTQAPTTSLAKVSCPFMDISRAVVRLLQKDKAAKQFWDSTAVMHVNKMWDQGRLKDDFQFGSCYFHASQGS